MFASHGGNSFAAPIPVTDTERFRTERLVPRSWQAPGASSQRVNSAAVLRISRYRSVSVNTPARVAGRAV